MAKRKKPSMAQALGNLAPTNGVATTEKAPVEINEFGHPIDIDESLKEHFERVDAAMRTEPELSPALAKLEEAEVCRGTPSPSIEQRLAALEAALLEKDTLIQRQASAIAIGIENADRLRKSRDKVNRLEAVADEAKKAASEAKKRHDAAVKEHFELEKDLDSGQARLPFPAEPEIASPTTIGKPVETPITEPLPGESEPEDDAWKLVPLAKLGIDYELSRGIVDKLADAGIATMGDLTAYQQPGPTGFCKKLTDIPGIGQAKADAIAEATMAFWSAWGTQQAKALETATLEAVRETEAERGGFAAPGRGEKGYAESLERIRSESPVPSANGEWEDSEPEGTDEADYEDELNGDSDYDSAND